MRPLAVTLAVVAGLIAPLPWSARAQVPPARHVLRWTRAPGAQSCIDAAALRIAVEARLRRRVFVDADVAPVVIEAHIAPASAGWHVAIAVRDGAGAALGARELDDPAPECRSVDDALALIIALIVDPDAATRAAPPTPAPAAAPWQFGLAANGTAAAGLLPGAAFGGALAVTFDAPRIPPGVVRATLWREDEAASAQVGARFDLATASVALCPRVWGRDAIDVATCGGGEAGRVSARGFGFDLSQRTTTLVGHVLIEPRLEVRLGRTLTIDAGLGLRVPIVRPRFTYDQGGMAVLLYQAPALAVVGHAGMGLHF